MSVSVAFWFCELSLTNGHRILCWVGASRKEEQNVSLSILMAVRTGVGRNGRSPISSCQWRRVWPSVG